MLPALYLSAVHQAAAWSLLTLCCLAGLTTNALATQATSWAPVLIDPGGELRAPTDPIKVKISAPSDVIQRLTLELDGFDVSQIVSFDNGVASFTPPQPLSFGEHKLRLVEYQTDGALIERGLWTLSIRKNSVFQDAELTGRVWLDASGRIADNNLSEPAPDRFTLGGGSQFQGKVVEGVWRVNGMADMLYNKNQSLMPRGADAGNVDLGNFLLTAQNGPVVAQVGHFNASPVDSLVMQGFTRRGVSVGLMSNENQNSLTAFSQRTEDVVGFEGGLGVGDPQNRSDGVVLTSHPLRDQPDKLLVNLVYVKGVGPDQSGSSGSGLAGDSTSTEGHATGLSADSNFFDHRLSVRGEYARSHFDFDGDGVDLDHDGITDLNLAAKTDYAYSVRVGYTPWHDKLLAGKPLAWNLGVENRRIGSYFRSPANPGGIADQLALHGFTDLNWSGLYAYAAFGNVTDNVKNDPLRPRIKSTDATLTVSYTPMIAAAVPDQTPTTPWYGQPSYTFGLTNVDQTVESAGGGYAEGDLNTTTSASLAASFSYPSWNWMVSQVVSTNDNKNAEAVDSRNLVTQLSLAKRVSDKINFSTNLQYGVIAETNPPAGVIAKDTDTWTAGMSLGYAFRPDMNMNLQSNYNDAATSDHSLDSSSRDLIASLSWAVRRADSWRPGLTLWLEGQRHDVTGTAATTTTTTTTIANADSYQVFLKASVDWALNY